MPAEHDEGVEEERDPDPPRHGGCTTATEMRSKDGCESNIARPEVAQQCESEEQGPDQDGAERCRHQVDFGGRGHVQRHQDDDGCRVGRADPVAGKPSDEGVDGGAR